MNELITALGVLVCVLIGYLMGRNAARPVEAKKYKQKKEEPRGDPYQEAMK